MSVRVGLLSPGDMGAEVARVLLGGGAQVVTCLAGRSERTIGLSRSVGIGEVDSLDELVTEVDLVLSILVPAQAGAVAEAVAASFEATKRQPVYVDANAVSPSTVHEIAATIDRAGAPFVDAGIIGPPPRTPGVCRFYASGEHADRFARLHQHGLDVRVIGNAVGAASALKMSYAAITKGTTLLSAAAMAMAQRLGVYDNLIEEFELSQESRLRSLETMVPNAAPKAHRWVGEMEEIAATFDSAGLPDGFHQAAAVTSMLLAQTPAGQETPEEVTERTLGALIVELADQAGE